MTNTLYGVSGSTMLIISIFCVFAFVTYADKRYEKLCLSGAAGLFLVFAAMSVCSLLRVNLYAKNAWFSVVLFILLILSVVLVLSGLIILGWNRSIQSIKKKLLDELREDMNLGAVNAPAVQTPSPAPTAAPAPVTAPAAKPAVITVPPMHQRPSMLGINPAPTTPPAGQVQWYYSWNWPREPPQCGGFFNLFQYFVASCFYLAIAKLFNEIQNMWNNIFF